MASAVAWRLYQARIRTLFMMEIAEPLAVRREVSFCEAVHDGRRTVEGVEALLAADTKEVPRIWEQGRIAVVVDPQWHAIEEIKPDVVVDAILAKRNLGTALSEAPLVIGLGPGFTAGHDVHTVIETNRGHNLGRVIIAGAADPDTGIPGPIGGHTEKRVLRAPRDGVFLPRRAIGEFVKAGEALGTVEDQPVTAGIDGVLRGVIRGHRPVTRGMKIGDIDPRGEVGYCYTISDKSRAIAGSVLEAVMRRYNRD